MYLGPGLRLGATAMRLGFGRPAPCAVRDLFPWETDARPNGGAGLVSLGHGNGRRKDGRMEG